MSGEKKTHNTARRTQRPSTLPAPVEAVTRFGFSLPFVMSVFRNLLSSNGAHAASAASDQATSTAHVTASALLTAVDDAVRHSGYTAHSENADAVETHHEHGEFVQGTSEINFAASLHCDCKNDERYRNRSPTRLNSNEEVVQYDESTVATTTEAAMCPPRDGTTPSTTAITTGVAAAVAFQGVSTTSPTSLTTSVPATRFAASSHAAGGVTNGVHSAPKQDGINEHSSGQTEEAQNSTSRRRSRDRSMERGDTTPADGDDSGERSRQVKRLRVLRAENRRLKARRMCRQCHVRPVSLTLLPCGHFLFCQECGSTFTACPVCRKTILADVRTFVS